MLPVTCSIKEAKFTINRHCTGCRDISSITGVHAGISDMAFHDLKEPFSPHGINAQVFARLHLTSILKRVDTHTKTC